VHHGGAADDAKKLGRDRAELVDQLVAQAVDQGSIVRTLGNVLERKDGDHRAASRPRGVPDQHRSSRANDDSGGQNDRPFLAGRRRRGGSLLHRSDEAVTAPGHRLDIPGGFGIVVQGGPDLRDAHVEAAVEVDKDLASPDLALDLLAGAHAARALGQHPQDTELLGREFEQHPSATQLVVPEIQLERAKAQGWNLDADGCHGSQYKGRPRPGWGPGIGGPGARGKHGR